MKTLTLTTLACAIAMSCSLVHAETSTSGELTKNFYGDLRAQTQWMQGRDFETSVYQATAGIKGMYKTPLANVIYHGEVQYSESDLASNQVDVREAYFVFKTHGYGAFVAGTGATGSYLQMYTPFDIHQSNSMHPDTAAQLFRQSKYGTRVIAYATPAWQTPIGAFDMKFGLVTPDANTGKDDDIKTARLNYKAGPVSLSVHRAQTSKQLLNKEEDYIRWNLFAKYEWENSYIAALKEFHDECPTKTEEVYGAVYSISHGAFDTGITYQYKTWDSTLQRDDIHLTIASVKYNYDEHIALFVEGAHYSEALNEYSDSNVSLGFIFSF
ncbi:porin [Ferrimonas pelagia]|uniref:Porin n=1 Tax=Ferrimonas pelagia TaxID=1177826 RepID=A0ABP9ERJ6_9GAMM